jgi:hypothetical protein
MELMVIEPIISSALHSYLTDRVRSGGQGRYFFRLDGFNDDVYRYLLTRLDADEGRIANQPLIVRTTAPILGYEAYQLEEGKSATWHRNNVPLGHVLILIFNQRTTDEQSLGQIYSVTETLITTDGLDCLIKAAFQIYQPSQSDVAELKKFILRLKQALFEPQLHDLAEFLAALDNALANDLATTIQEAIARSLPYLGLFRCRELATSLDTPKADRLLREIHAAARLGGEIIDERQRENLLARLDASDLVDESDSGGPSSADKRDWLRRFLTEVISDRGDLLRVLQLEWEEINSVLRKKARQTRTTQLQTLAQELDQTFDQQQLRLADLPDYAQDVLHDLDEGQVPDDDALEEFTDEYQDLLGKRLTNSLRRLLRPKVRIHSDLIVGLTALAVELLNPLQGEIQPNTTLHVVFLAERMVEVKQKEAEALVAFRVLYGGIDLVLPTVTWELAPLWELMDAYPDWEADETADEREREKVRTTELPFRVVVRDATGQDLARAELIWQYRSDSPAATTLANLQAEKNRLDQLGGGDAVLAIPLYNTCPAADDVGDLDLQRPRQSLGTWYESPGDLRQLLREQIENRAGGSGWSAIEPLLTQAERAWGYFVGASARDGILAADLEALLAAYDNLLCNAAEHWQSGQSASYGYRILTQAWIVGPPTFDEWAVVPFLHPLKLSWWRARAQHFDGFIKALLDNVTPTTVVNEGRFRQQLTSTYGSANFPTVLALPPRTGLPDLFLPVDEVDGYELYRRQTLPSSAYGADPDELLATSDVVSTQSTADALAYVIRDYIETYPFVRDGVEIFLLQCRDSALPSVLVSRLAQLAEQRQWTIRMSVVIHTTEYGAPLFRRIADWLQTNETWAERPAGTYFPPVTLKVLECAYEDLFQQLSNMDTDIVVLPDVLSERGQSVEAVLSDDTSTDAPLRGYLPIYRTQQEPFVRNEYSRVVLLNPPPQPALVRHFYNAQWAAKQRKPIRADQKALFRKVFSLQEWEEVLRELHERFNWVVCYDMVVDRFLLEDTFPGVVQVIRYSLGLGAKRRHNLTVSSSNRAQSIVVRRLTRRLDDLLPNTPDTFRQEIAQCLVDEAKKVSGDIVLRAAGPGAYLNELIGLVVAKHKTEQQYLTEHPGALIAWIYLDDFRHWFEGKLPDLLFVAIPPEASGELSLHMEVIETKCVGQASFGTEAIDAQRQTTQGVNRLYEAWAPDRRHLDALYWYDQLERAIVGNLAVAPEQVRLWSILQQHLREADFTLGMSGHSWVFCYDGLISLGSGQMSQEGHFSQASASAAPNCELWYHHYNRAGLRKALWEIKGDTGQLPPDDWSLVPSTPPTAPTPESPISNLPAPELVSIEESPMLIAQPVEAETSTNLDLVWLESKARELERALRQYSIQIYPVDPMVADVGPSVVRFKVRLRPGEQLIRLQRTANDLARELALTSVPLIDNVLGSNYVGIDLPRPQPETVYLMPLLELLPKPAPGELWSIFGLTPNGRPVIEDLAEFPHLLVAGATNSGKSVFLRSLLLCLITQYTPNNLQIVVVDPKRTDFSFFEGLPYLLGKRVITDRNEARDALLDLVQQEMPRRQQLMAGRSMRLKEFNRRYPEEALPPIVAIIDEYAQLLSIMAKAERDSFERDLMSLAAVARATGIHLILATQRPSADVVTGTLKANLPASIAFKVASAVNSRIVIDQGGAENLLGNGDMLFRRPSGELIRLQAPFVDEVSIQNYLQRFKRT